MRLRYIKPFGCAMAILVAGAMAFAQDYPPAGPYPQNGAPAGQPPYGQGDNPAAPGPGRGMARISLMNGNVSVRRGDSGEPTAAVLNAPVGSGDTVLTSAAARVELQFDSADVARIAANSEVHMGDLQYHHNQIQVALGLVTFTVIRNSQSQSEIDTPDVAVHPKGQGAFRILVREDGVTEITVRAGEADIASAIGSQVLKAGQTMMVRGSQQDPEFQIVEAIQEDDWDRWNVERDRQLTRSMSTRYVNPDVYGAEDLDQYGRWVNDGSYGQVWSPSGVGADWAPYQAGRWVWEDYYGWTWVSSDPWGWAPYHYGRWYHASFGWAWWPGPVGGPCYWSPALVGFFGWGGRVGFGFGFANVGWVPLAPFEVFHPWWGGGYGFHNTVIVNNFNVYGGFRNARYAAIGVRAESFGRGGAAFGRVGASEIRSAGMVRGGLPMTPDRASLRFSDRSVNMSGFRQSRTTQFYSRSGSTGVYRGASFEQQRQAMEQSRQSFSRGSSFSGNGAGAATRGGWNRVEPGSQPAAGYRGATTPSYSARPSGGPSNGWSRFGGTSGEPRTGSVPQPAGRSGGYTPRAGGDYRSSGQSYGGGNPVRISPPIVSQRAPQTGSAPRTYGGGSYGSGYSGRQPSYSAPSGAYGAGRGNYSAPRSAPSYSAPRYSAPRSAPSYSAPRSAPSGGGGHYSGGGGGHSGGGGGGGHHR